MNIKHGTKAAPVPKVPDSVKEKVRSQLDMLEDNLSEHINFLNTLIMETSSPSDKVKYSKERVDARKELVDIYNKRAKQGI